MVTLSLPSPSFNHDATKPSRAWPADFTANTTTRRREFAFKSTFPKLVLTANSESANETVSKSPLAVASFAVLLETQSIERMSFTASFKLPSSAEWNLKCFSTL